MAMALDTFVGRVVDSQLLTADELRNFVEQAAEEKRPKDGDQLARELVKQKKLTAYQAKTIYAGKGKTLTLGSYRILDKLGEGGMGTVYKAEHARMQRTVALKVISSAAMKDVDAVKRFHREVQAAARLIHPNIVTAFDASDHAGLHFLVMEYVEGQDLAVIVSKQGALAVSTAVDYVLQAARGLAYAHSKGVVHRDIKPGNLLVDREGTLKILDMGLARIELSAGGSHELTNTGQVMGTIDYMAPEQAEDTHSADARADIYSLGCTLYRLLSGELMYGGDSVIKKLLAHRSNPIPSLRTVCPAAPAALDEIFRKMVAKRPEDRQQTMHEVAAALEALNKGLPHAAHPPAAVEVTTDLKLSEFLAGLGGSSAKGAPTATVNAAATKVSSATEVTQDFRRGDTNPALQKSLTAPAGPTAAPVALPIPIAQQLFRNKTAIWIAAALGGLALAAAGVVMFLPAGDSTIRVEINDPSIEVTVSDNGYKIKGPSEEIHLKPGEHTLHVKTGDLEFDTTKFTLGKGENPPLKVELLPGKVQVVAADGKILGEKSKVSELASGAKSNASATRPTAGSAVNATSIWTNLFNDRDLTGWLQKGHAGWSVKGGLLTGESLGAVGWLMSEREYGDFELELEYRLPPGGNSGVFLRAPAEGQITGAQFNEIQLLDDPSPKFANVDPKGRNGALFNQIAPTKAPIKMANEWRKLLVRVEGPRVFAVLDGAEILNGQLRSGTAERGHIGFQLYAPSIAFRNIRIRELNAGTTTNSALEFDGVSDHVVRIPTLLDNGSGPLTVEAWVTPRKLTDATAAILGPSNNNSGARLDIGSGAFVFKTYEPAKVLAASQHMDLNGSRAIHVAGVRDGQTLRIYVDGKQSSEPLKVFEDKLNGRTPGFLNLGFTGGGTHFAGLLHEVRVSKVARYSQNFVPSQRFESDKDTLALYHFDEGQGDVLNDASGNGHHGKIIGAKWAPKNGGAAKAAPTTELPTSADLRPEFERLKLPLRGQGARGAANAVCVTTSALEFAASKQRGQSTPLSAEFLFWACNKVLNIKNERPPFFRDLLSGFRRYGVCLESDMPFQPKFDAALQPSEQALRRGLEIESLGLTVNWINPLQPQIGLNDEHLTKIKAVLVQGYPVAAGSSHSRLLIGYEDKPELPGGGRFLVKDSAGAGSYTDINYASLKEKFNDIFWIEPGKPLPVRQPSPRRPHHSRTPHLPRAPPSTSISATDLAPPVSASARRSISPSLSPSSCI